MLPGTVQSVTGGGGLHLLYRHPGHKVTSSAHQLGRGLDVKADGGQIVAPPSVHPSGRRYRWLGDVWQEPLAPWPAKLTDRPQPRPVSFQLPPTRAAVVLRVAGVFTFLMEAQPGERNARLYWATCRVAECVAERLIPERDAYDRLLAVALRLELSEPEARATIGSAFRRLVQVAS